MSTPISKYPLPLKLLIAGRLAVAFSFIFIPRTIMSTFGMDAEGTPGVPMGRMFAIRNAALAVGLLNLSSFTNPRTFLKINAFIDFVDALAFMAAGRRGEISSKGAVLSTGVALSAVGGALGGLLLGIPTQAVFETRNRQIVWI